MIITKKKAIEEILASLNGKKSVYLFGCDSCAEQCSTGGEKELKEMTRLLEEAGIRVLGANPGGSGETIAIASPISGRIISRNTNIGQMASPADAIFTVANQSQVWIEADVYEKDLARIRKGTPSKFVVVVQTTELARSGGYL